MTEQQSISDCKAKSNATKQKAEALRKRTRGIIASSNAARDLMMRQTSSVSTACSKLEVCPPSQELTRRVQAAFVLLAIELYTNNANICISEVLQSVILTH